MIGLLHGARGAALTIVNPAAMPRCHPQSSPDGSMSPVPNAAEQRAGLSHGLSGK